MRNITAAAFSIIAAVFWFIAIDAVDNVALWVISAILTLIAIILFCVPSTAQEQPQTHTAKSKSKSNNAPQVDTHKILLEQLELELKNNTHNINTELSESQLNKYTELCNSFELIKLCSHIWSLSLIYRKDAKLCNVPFSVNGSVVNVPTFKLAEGDLYFHPQFILLSKSTTDFQIYNYKDLSLSISDKEFTEYDGYAPSDAERIKYTWEHTTKTGEVDLRYKQNKMLPVVSYGIINIFLKYSTIKLCFSSKKHISNFVQAITKYKECLNPNSTKQISDSAFNLAKSIAQKFYSMLFELNNEPLIIAMCDKIGSVNQINGIYSQYIDVRLYALAIYDIQNYFEKFYDKLNSPEGIPIILLIRQITHGDIANITYDELISHIITIEMHYDLIKAGIKTNLKNGKSLLGELMIQEKIDCNFIDKYSIALYRFMNIIAKTDNIITTEEANLLASIMAYNKKDDDMSLSKKQLQLETTTNMPKTTGNALADLDKLIGLENVKTEVNNIYNLIKLQNIRKEKGLKTPNISYHCVFTGNPGTGKTTVARLVAQIYRELGILQKGHLVETDRSGLVAEYVGQTAVKTNKIIDSALDGVLFIDEAYSLIQGSGNDYGKEAISTLLKRMEDDRNRLIVILAGYSNEMKQFIDSNPGLQSRFNRYIHFEDYNVDDLVSIFETKCIENDYKLDEAAKQTLVDVISSAVLNKDVNFGNARYVRNLFEKTLSNQANRLSIVTQITEEILTTIIAEDIPQK